MEEGAVNSRRGEGLKKVLSELDLFFLDKHSVRINCAMNHIRYYGYLYI